MALISLDTVTLPNWHATTTAGAGEVLLRIYLNRTFLTSDGVQLQPGSPGGGKIYQQVECTVSSADADGNHTLTIPDIDIDSTTDGQDTVNARYSAYFYKPSGAKIGPFAGFESFQVPAVFPTTGLTTGNWELLRIYNSGHAPIPLDRDTYSRSQINALIAAGSSSAFGWKISSGRVVQFSAGQQVLVGAFNITGTSHDYNDGDIFFPTYQHEPASIGLGLFGDYSNAAVAPDTGNNFLFSATGETSSDRPSVAVFGQMITKTGASGNAFGGNFVGIVESGNDHPIGAELDAVNVSATPDLGLGLVIACAGTNTTLNAIQINCNTPESRWNNLLVFNGSVTNPASESLISTLGTITPTVLFQLAASEPTSGICISLPKPIDFDGDAHTSTINFNERTNMVSIGAIGMLTNATQSFVLMGDTSASYNGLLFYAPSGEAGRIEGDLYWQMPKVKLRGIVGLDDVTLTNLNLPGAPTLTEINCTQIAGTVSVLTDSATSAQPLFRVNFGTAFSAAPHVILVPRNADTAALTSFVDTADVTTGAFSVRTTTNLAGATTYVWSYFVIGV